MEDPKLSEKVNGDKAAAFSNSAYFQMRALVRDLNPNFLEVLKDPAYKNSDAAQEIRQKMDQLMQLYKQVTAEPDFATKNNKAPDNNTAPKQGPDAHTIPSMRVPGKPQAEEFRVPGTYVVGGSAFGWNFITFPGNQAVYYGMTKEAFRATQAIFS